jgi:hypothetical protein
MVLIPSNTKSTAAIPAKMKMTWRRMRIVMGQRRCPGLARWGDLD